MSTKEMAHLAVRAPGQSGGQGGTVTPEPPMAGVSKATAKI